MCNYKKTIQVILVRIDLPDVFTVAVTEIYTSDKTGQN